MTPKIFPERLLFMDTETTFPRPGKPRRVMELSIIDNNGMTVYHSIFNPGFNTEDSYSRKGLPDRLLRQGATFEEAYPLIQQLLVGKHVVAWWMENEKTFFPDNLSCAGKLICAQARCSPHFGRYSPFHGNHKSVAMWDAFDHLGMEQQGGMRHRANCDVHAMRSIWNWLDDFDFDAMLRNRAA